MRLNQKVAIVTGGASGIGRAAALLFAREGARVVVADLAAGDGHKSADLIRDSGGHAIFVDADVTRPEDASRLVERALAAYGRLDVLFNNAGVDHPDARSVVDTADDLWDRTIAVNLKGVFLVSRAALGPMIRAGSGSIVNTASIAGLVGTPAEAAYCASKGGVVLLTRQMALDFGPYGVRVNCVCPGAMAEPARDRRAALDEEGVARRLARAARNPLGRAGRPEDVAYAALYLASDESAFVTGTALVVDGGFTAA
jgi:NAD(P)-dependent dehydrogenase (short-subunit alcohol dehydrogenase family)